MHVHALHVLDVLLLQAGHGAGQTLPRLALAGARLAYDHVAVPRHLAVKHLDNFGHVGGHGHEVVLRELRLQRLPQLRHHLHAVSGSIPFLDYDLGVRWALSGQLHPREEVGEQGLEEGQVEVDQLGLDEVLHGAEHDHLLGGVGVHTLHRARRAADGDDEGAQAVVVVVLLGQLLLTQLHDGDHLLGQRLRRLEPLAEHHDLRDQGEVRHHH
eukprot:1184688-Prorocentrum_minimum.AAC.1